MDLSIFRKAVSLGTTAALLASLAATVVAPAAALADYSATGTVTVGAGGTSATAPTFTFNDNSTFAKASPGPVGGFQTLTFPATLTVTICDSANTAVTTAGAFPGCNNSSNTLSFSGTPTISAPASLGASVTASGNSFTVKITGADPNNAEQFSVTGLKIAATSSAATARSRPC